MRTNAGEERTILKWIRETPNYNVYEAHDVSGHTVAHIPKTFISGDQMLSGFMSFSWSPKTIAEVRSKLSPSWRQQIDNFQRDPEPSLKPGTYEMLIESIDQLTPDRLRANLRVMTETAPRPYGSYYQDIEELRRRMENLEKQLIKKQPVRRRRAGGKKR